jgi:hypothetical protein
MKTKRILLILLTSLLMVSCKDAATGIEALGTIILLLFKWGLIIGGILLLLAIIVSLFK